MNEQDTAKNLDIGITIAVATLVEAMGMHWENQGRIQRGEALAYPGSDFDGLLERNGCHWNEVIGRWIER